MSDLTITFQGHEVPLIINNFSPGYPYKTNCPPEDSYPSEPSEVDFKINTGNEHLNDLLQENYFNEIEELALEAVEQVRKEAMDERAEQAYEDQRDRRLGL